MDDDWGVLPWLRKPSFMGLSLSKTWIITMPRPTPKSQTSHGGNCAAIQHQGETGRLNHLGGQKPLPRGKDGNLNGSPNGIVKIQKTVYNSLQHQNGRLIQGSVVWAKAFTWFLWALRMRDPTSLSRWAFFRCTAQTGSQCMRIVGPQTWKNIHVRLSTELCTG